MPNLATPGMSRLRNVPACSVTEACRRPHGLRSSGGQKVRIPVDEYQQELTHIAFLLSGLEADEVWLAYLSYGATAADGPWMHI